LCAAVTAEEQYDIVWYQTLVGGRISNNNHSSAGAWAKKYHLASRAAIEAILRPYDLGSTQWQVLWHLINDGSLPQGDLLQLLQVEKPSLSGVVAALVRKGLIEQSVNELDQRQKLLSVTREGRKLWKVLPDPIDIILKTAFADVDEASLETVVRVLSTGTMRLQEFARKAKQS
jgi:DNA-binding MarR family transcriptional regulator